MLLHERLISWRAAWTWNENRDTLEKNRDAHTETCDTTISDRWVADKYGSLQSPLKKMAASNLCMNAELAESWACLQPRFARPAKNTYSYWTMQAFYLITVSWGRLTC